MAKTDLSKLSAKEYKGYFTDYLEYLVRNTFDIIDRLMFVTYQPTELTLSDTDVVEHTKYLFGDLPYVEVLEQTFVSSGLLKCGHLIDGYHSHLLIRESDYLAIKNKIDSLGLNIVAKFTYNLDGLISDYLIKQAGTTHLRKLPIQNIPIKKSEPIALPETVTVTIGIRIKTQVQIVLRVFRKVSVSLNVSYRFKNINKIYWMHMFVDDT